MALGIDPQGGPELGGLATSRLLLIGAEVQKRRDGFLVPLVQLESLADIVHLDEDNL